MDLSQEINIMKLLKFNIKGAFIKEKATEYTDYPYIRDESCKLLLQKFQLNKLLKRIIKNNNLKKIAHIEMTLLKNIKLNL